MRSLAIVLSLAGCLAPQEQLQRCGENFCSENTTCVLNHCATPGQLAACDGLDEGVTCSLAGVVGRCEGGVCLPAGCGNNILDLDEVCDDGNVDSGDGCRADCQKLEMCGDALLDEGERCDDGNLNPADGCDACAPTMWMATALIGSNASGTAQALGRPQDVAVDRNGILFIVDTGNLRIRRLHPNGTMTIVAGTGDLGFSGDGGPATNARFNAPQGIAIDGVGNIYVADSSNARVRKIDLDGIITTFAGNGSFSGTGDGGPAAAAGLNRPIGVAVDGLGNVYIAETLGHRVRKVDTNGVITTYAGTGTTGFAGDDGPAAAAQIASPRGLAVDVAGNLFIADQTNRRIRKVALDGTITTVAGIGTAGLSGDGGLATSAQFLSPIRVAVDAAGQLFITDQANQRIRKVAANGTITTYAGTGATGSDNGGFAGDGGPATSALIADPEGLAIDSNGDLAVCDTTNNRIRRISATGVISTIAGSGENGYTGDGGPAVASPLLFPVDVTIDGAGNLYFAEQFAHRVRKVSTTGTITTAAGIGVSGNTGDNGPATQARLNNPAVVLADGSTLYIAAQHVVRKVDANGTITRVAGDGTSGFIDNTSALSARLNEVGGLAIKNGELYIADRGNYRIRKIATNGQITTIAGTGASGSSGDGGLATAAQLNYPGGMAFDGAGNLVFADTNNFRVRKIDANGMITTIAGTTAGFSGDGGPATSAQLTVRDVAIDGAGNIYVSDASNHRIRKIDTNGDISTFAGTGATGFAGDGGLAATALLDTPLGLVFDSTGRLYFADSQYGGMRVVRRIDPDGRIWTVAGGIDPVGSGPLATGALARPLALVHDTAFTLFAGGQAGIVQLLRPGASAVETVVGRYPQISPYATPTPATGVLARFRGSSFGTIDGIAYDATNARIFIAQASTHVIQVVTIVNINDPTTWTIAPFANTAGTAGFVDGAVATARFRAPAGLFLDGNRLLVADSGNHVVRAIDLAGGLGAATVTTIAGTPAVRGYFGEGVPATTALLQTPMALTRCANGDIFVADTGNERVRRIAGTTISTVVGDGTRGSSGEGAPANTFPVDTPLGLACDALNNLYVTSTNVVRLLPSSSGKVDGQGEVHTIFALPPRDEFPASAAACLTGIVNISPVVLRFVDSCTGLLVELERKPAG